MSFKPGKVGMRVVRRGNTVLRGFVRFLLRGRTADLAVAVVIGAAIGALVNSFVKDIFTPLLAALFGSSTDFAGRSLEVGGQSVRYGDFINSLIAFLVVAAVVYFLIIVPTNRLVSNAYLEAPPDPAMRKCPECESEIPKAAHRCMYCTQPVTPISDGSS
jgi:large conductance mechanosensitive channel